MADPARPLRVAIVGAGPAGLYTADSLTSGFDVPVEVDLLERLPAPYGLLRYGVAPDHLKIKAVADTLHEILERPNVSLFANIEIGRDITVDEIRERYDAVVYAHGASADRTLGIPGENLTGSVSATSFVDWYNGHPDRIAYEVLNAQSVVVVGLGNVALDVARILLKDPTDLEHTDIPHDVVEVLRKSAVTEVHIVGRRGAQFAKFTTNELREFGALAEVEICLDDHRIPEDDPPGVTPVVRRNLAVLRDWVQREKVTCSKRLFFHFGAKPVEILGADHVQALRCERSSDDGVGTGETFDIPAQMVLRSVGYRSVPMPGLPVDEGSSTVPTLDHRVLRGDGPSLGEYAVGWVKRGPTGILGTNRSDAKATIAALREDLPALFAGHTSDPGGIAPLLAERGIRYIDLPRWLAIMEAEGTHGVQHGRSRVKMSAWEDLLKAAGYHD